MEKSLKRTVGEGAAYFFSNTILIKLVGLATTFVVLSNLSPYEYGLAELVLSIVPLGSFFLLSGLGQVLVADMGTEVSKGNAVRAKTLFRHFFTLQFFASVIVFLVVFLGAEIIANHYHEKTATLIRIVSFGFFAFSLRSAAMILFSVKLKFALQSVYTFSEEIIKLVLIVIFLVGFGFATEGLVLAAVLSQLLALAFMAPALFSIYRSFGKGPLDVTVRITDLLRYHGKWSLFSGYLGSFGQNIRLWIIRLFLGTEAVGLFAVAMGMVGHTTSLMPLDKVMKPIIPQYYSDTERFYHIINKAVKYQFFGYLFIGIVAFFLFPPIIGFLFPDYIPAMPLFIIMLLMLVPHAPDSILVSVFHTIKAQRSLFFASLYKIILTIVLLSLFLPIFGLNGVAYAFVVIAFLYAYERYRALRKLLPDFSLSLAEIFTWDDVDSLILGKIKASVRRSVGIS